MMDKTRIDKRTGTELIHILIHSEYQFRRFVFQFIAQATPFGRRECERQQFRLLLFLENSSRHKRILGSDTHHIDLLVEPGQEIIFEETFFQRRDIRPCPVEFDVSIKETLAHRRTVCGKRKSTRPKPDGHYVIFRMISC